MRREAEFLRHQAKTQALCLLRGAHDLCLTVDGDRAAIRRDQPHENLDERALPRAVLAAQRSNFSAPKRKRDIFERGDARIGFAHAPDRQDLLQQPSSPPKSRTRCIGRSEGRRQIGARRVNLHICSPCFSRKSYPPAVMVQSAKTPHGGALQRDCSSWAGGALFVLSTQEAE